MSQRHMIWECHDSILCKIAKDSGGESLHYLIHILKIYLLVLLKAGASVLVFLQLWMDHGFLRALKAVWEKNCVMYLLFPFGEAFIKTKQKNQKQKWDECRVKYNVAYISYLEKTKMLFVSNLINLLISFKAYTNISQCISGSNLFSYRQLLISYYGIRACSCFMLEWKRKERTDVHLCVLPISVSVVCIKKSYMDRKTMCQYCASSKWFACRDRHKEMSFFWSWQHMIIYSQMQEQIVMINRPASSNFCIWNNSSLYYLHKNRIE